jgi:two-component system NarL family sensor kinase
LLEKAGSDSIKARTNFFLVYYWLPRDTAKAGEHLRAGRALSRKYPYLEAVSYAHEAYFYYNIDIAMSEAAYLKADSLLSRYTNKEAFLARSNIWFNYAVLQQRKDDDETYTDIVLNKSIPLAIRSGDSAVMGSQYISVGVAFMNIEQYDKAEVYLDYAINVLRRARTQVTRLIVAYNRAGENYMFLKKYDHAKHVLDTVKSLLAPYPESELYTGYYMVEGMYYQQMRLYNLALESYDKGIASAKGLNKSYRIQELLFFKIKTCWL